MRVRPVQAPGRGVVRSVALSCAVMIVAAACGSPQPTPRAAVTVTSGPAPTTPAPLPAEGIRGPLVGGDGPGALLSAEPFTTLDYRVPETGATATKIRYVSTKRDGSRSEVTGTVFVPAEEPPLGGWPVVVYGHGNTGINFDCGPSQYDDLLNQTLPITALLLNGFLVVMPDYEGLGGPGRHPFLDSKTLGNNMIDGVRAARSLTPDAGRRWAAFGGSLGGLATWSANEQASTYGGDLELVGAAAWVPVVNVSDLPRKAAEGTLTRDQMHLYFLAIMGLAATTHPELDLSDYLRGGLAANREVLTLCVGPRVADAVTVLKDADPVDLRPASAEAEVRMQRWLQELAVPQQRTAAPMLVIYGTDDLLVDQAWIERALDQACDRGDQIQWILRPGEGHGDIDAAFAFDWMRARFDGQAALDQCGLAR